MSIYKCNVCGYEYKPEEGDPAGGIKEGTDFNDLPDSWLCPVCGCAKNDFEELD